jgi:HNH endonuclease
MQANLDRIAREIARQLQEIYRALERRKHVKSPNAVGGEGDLPQMRTPSAAAEGRHAAKPLRAARLSIAPSQVESVPAIGDAAMTKSRGILGPRKRWSEDEIALIRRDYPDRPAREIADALGIKIDILYSKARKLGVTKSAAFRASERSGRATRDNNLGVQYRFKKGEPSPFKGKPRGYPAGETTQFKPGRRDPNYLPIGTVRLLGNGYLSRKVRDDRKGGRNWEAEHRLIWKAAHGPIPSGHVVAFKQGRHTTVLELITLDAVELITREEHMRRYTLHNLYPKEVVQVIQLKGAVVRQINRRVRLEKQD